MILIGDAAELVLTELSLRVDGFACWHRFPGTPEYCTNDREFGSEFCKAHQEQE